MKRLSRNRIKVFLILMGFSSFKGQAATFELTTLLGTANQAMPYVQEVVKNHVPLVAGMSVMDFSTGVVYFSWKNGTQSIQTIQVLQDDGMATLANVTAAIDLASINSAIVLAPLTGSQVEAMCAKMAEKKDVAFLVTLGEVGYVLSPLHTKCASRNILFVTRLNAQLTDLGEYASYGPLVRLAVPGETLSAPVDGSRTVSYLSDGFGMAVAAGKLSVLLRSNPSLKGEALLDQLLESTVSLPALEGKIPGAKALLQFEQ